MPLSSAVAKELGRRVRTSGSAPAAAASASSSSDDSELRAAALSAAAPDSAASDQHKKAKHDADIDGSNNIRSNAATDEVWGANEDDYDDDPFASSNTSPPGAAATGSNNAGAVKSFSLFDMLDSQPGMGFGAERVSAQKILSAFGGINASNAGGGDDTTTMEDDSNARCNEAASLLERVDDLEDLLFDPFGESGGDCWPDINRILRCGLGLGDAGDTGKDSSDEKPPSLDVIVRYARIHSKLDGLCGSSSSSSGIDFGPQRMELLINMADALMAMHCRAQGKWCTINNSGEVYMAEGMVTLVQIMLDMFISSVPVLEVAMKEDSHRLLLITMKVLVMEPSPECGGISLAHAISASDPYAEWFSFLSRFVHQGALIKAAVEAGLLRKVVEICNAGPGRKTTPVNSVAVLTNNSDMVAIGTAADLDHCLYLHSLSILRTLLVVTAASERAFPYQDIGAKAGDSLSENAKRVLYPFINVLSVGANGGTAVVDERLASLCEEASGTVLRAIKPNKTVFQTVFQAISSATLKETVTANANPSVSAINRLQKLAS